MLWFLCSHCLPHWWIEFLFGVDVPQVCLHHCESHPHWSWYQSLSLRKFSFFGGCVRSGKLQYFLQYFRLLYCLFHFGRVLRFGNEQCFRWWCCPSFELRIGPMVLLGGSLQIGGFLYGSPLTGHLRGLDLSHYLPWTVITLLGSASPGLQL